MLPVRLDAMLGIISHELSHDLNHLCSVADLLEADGVLHLLELALVRHDLRLPLRRHHLQLKCITVSRLMIYPRSSNGIKDNRFRGHVINQFSNIIRES